MVSCLESECDLKRMHQDNIVLHDFFDALNPNRLKPEVIVLVDRLYMDETSYRLCQLLMMDPRMQHRDLADRLGLSIQAVHRRFQCLTDEGILAGFTADVSMDYLKAIRVCVWGRSKAQTMDDVLQPLCINDSTLEIFLGSGNFIYVVGLLRNLTDLESFTEHVVKAGQIQDAQVGIEGYGLVSGIKVIRGRTTQGEPTALDYRIINALHRDARKSMTKISDELGISIKTIRKRLAKLINDGLIEFSVDWRTGEAGGIVSMMMIELRDDAIKDEVGLRIIKPGRTYILLGTCSNLPNMVFLLAWAKSIQEMGRLTDEVRKEEGVRSIMPHILTKKYRSYDTWRDKVLAAESSNTSITRPVVP